MYRSHPALTRIVVTVVLAATIVFGLASVARADDWARQDAAAQAFASLDPAIRTAIAEHRPDAALATHVDVPTRVVDDGFAWGAAALGVGVGIAAMCAAIACVTLIRHDGRLRNA